MIERGLIIANHSDITKKTMFKYELTINPPALCDSEGNLRVADDKANLMEDIANNFHKISPTEGNLSQIDKTVIDMGSVLRSRVKFEKGMTYGDIINKYVKLVMNYRPCIPVFDGYSDDYASTKHITHVKRSRKLVPSNNVALASHLPFNCESKDAFFANKTNKQLFINMLSKKLEEVITVMHAKGDADQLIAKTAIDIAVDFTTKVLAEDTYIFQLLICLLKPNSNDLYMVTEKKNAKNSCLHINHIRKELVKKLGEECAIHLPVIHAISGCDTTSKPYGVGKITVMRKSKQICKEAGPFLSESATHQQIEEAGRKILCLIYEENPTDYDLDRIRLNKFEQSVIKSMKAVLVQRLPPTNSAAKYHSFRVYYQVQAWLGNEHLHKATDWGWELIKGNLHPKTMDLPPAPKALMKVMKCSCKLHCENNICTCKKHGLYCTEFCNNCTSGNCKNIDDSDLQVDDLDLQVEI